MKPNFKFQVATIGPDKQLAYVLSVNGSWYRTGKLINPEQRQLLKERPMVRRQLKYILKQRFWRHIGAS